MYKPRRGFTLVELLAVIVILAVILIIAVPQIMNVITEARKGALMSSAKLIASSAETAYISNQTLGIEKNIECRDISNYRDEDYDRCTITFDSNGNAKVTIVGKGKFEGMSVCSATKEDAEISSECATDVACFAYEIVDKQITGYAINEDACKMYYTRQGVPTDVAETLCTGVEVDGSPLKDNINDAIQDGSEEAMSYLNGLETEGVISIQYSGSISITGYSDTCPKDVIIPGEIDNKTVTSIGNGAFTTNGVNPNQIKNDLLYENYEVSTLDAKSYNDNILPIFYLPIGIGLTSVTIPNSVTSIGEDAFRDNQLISVTIPNSVTSIGDFAFNGNQLISLTVGNGVTTIGVHAFSFNQLSDLTLGSGITTIGDYAFRNNQLTGVTIPESIASIGRMAFYKDSSYSNPNLTSIVNTTGRSFDWSNIITGSSGTSSVTETYNGVSVITK